MQDGDPSPPQCDPRTKSPQRDSAGRPREPEGKGKGRGELDGCICDVCLFPRELLYMSGVVQVVVHSLHVVGGTMQCTILMQVLLSIAHSLNSTHSIQHTLDIAHNLYSTLSIQHTLYTAHSRYSTQSIQHTLYTAHSLYSTLSIQHTIYTAHSLYSTLSVAHLAYPYVVVQVIDGRMCTTQQVTSVEGVVHVPANATVYTCILVSTSIGYDAHISAPTNTHNDKCSSWPTLHIHPTRYIYPYPVHQHTQPSKSLPACSRQVAHPKSLALHQTRVEICQCKCNGCKHTRFGTAFEK